MKKGAVLFTGTLLFSCILFVFGIPRDQNLTSPGDPAPEVCFFCGRMLRYFHHFICIHMHSRSVKVMKTWKVFREEPKRQRVSRYGRSCRIPVLFGGPLQTRLPSWRQSGFPRVFPGVHGSLLRPSPVSLWNCFLCGFYHCNNSLRIWNIGSLWNRL